MPTIASSGEFDRVSPAGTGWEELVFPPEVTRAWITTPSGSGYISDNLTGVFNSAASGWVALSTSDVYVWDAVVDDVRRDRINVAHSDGSTGVLQIVMERS